MLKIFFCCRSSQLFYMSTIHFMQMTLSGKLSFCQCWITAASVNSSNRISLTWRNTFIIVHLHLNCLKSFNSTDSPLTVQSLIHKTTFYHVPASCSFLTATSLTSPIFLNPFFHFPEHLEGVCPHHISRSLFPFALIPGATHQLLGQSSLSVSSSSSGSIHPPLCLTLSVLHWSTADRKGFSHQCGTSLMYTQEDGGRSIVSVSFLPSHLVLGILSFGPCLSLC